MLFVDFLKWQISAYCYAEDVKKIKGALYSYFLKQIPLISSFTEKENIITVMRIRKLPTLFLSHPVFLLLSPACRETPSTHL